MTQIDRYAQRRSDAGVGVAAVAMAAAGFTLSRFAWWVGTHTDQGVRITDVESLMVLIGSASLFIVFAVARNRVGRRVTVAAMVIAAAIAAKSVADGRFGYTFLSPENLAVLGAVVSVCGAAVGVVAAVASWPDRSLRWKQIVGALVSLALAALTLLFFLVPGDLSVG